jgi:thiosulfate/3-mercaptopyruvate sulfurtransferase
MPIGPLLSPEALRDATASIRLLDARPGVELYAAGHLAGALFADLEEALSTAREPGFDPARGGRHPLPSPASWAARLGAWGIERGTPVVVYDAAGGGNAAARLWWMLRAVGHVHVAVLDGGFQAAVAAGLPVTQAPPPPVSPRTPYPVTAWELPLVDMETVADRVRDPAWKIIDVRSGERWRGKTEPFDPVPGRIPGTVNVPYTDNLGPDGRFKSPAALRAMYLELLGGTTPEHVAVHCGSGVTACHTLLALDVAGLPGASLYVGAYSVWCRSGRPLGRG